MYSSVCLRNSVLLLAQTYKDCEGEDLERGSEMQ